MSASVRDCVVIAGFAGPIAGYKRIMIILGLVLLLLGLVLSIPILWTIGVIVLIIGVVLMLLGRSGRQVGGRAHYW